MKCALELKTMINEREKEKREKELKEKWERFYQQREEIENLIEESLLKNKRFETYISKESYTETDFYEFVEKTDYCGNNKPYWYYSGTKLFVPLEYFCNYLRSLCYEVDIVERPYIGYSSTGKSQRKMEGLTLIVRIPENLKCD